VWGSNAEIANDDTFFFTNATPQHARLTQGNWNDLEDHILTNTDAHDLLVDVFRGPVFADDDPEYRVLPSAALLEDRGWCTAARASSTPPHTCSARRIF
jgi:DNA/RNA endonuclease G (NUC1)